MSVRFFILLLCISMTLQEVWTEDKKLHVTTYLQYDLNDPDSVNVTCQHDGMQDWDIGATLYFGATPACESKKPLPRSQNGNQVTVVMKNLTSAEKNFYYKCEVYKYYPLPVVTGFGNAIKLFPGCSCPADGSLCEKPEPVDSGHVCPTAEFPSLSGPLTWALIGLLVMLCLYSLCVTAVYIRLRVKRSEELYDTLTYVPMQVKPKRKVKRPDAEKNAEYMDMRKVRPHAGPVRDMNYNSHHIPSGFTM